MLARVQALLQDTPACVDLLLEAVEVEASLAEYALVEESVVGVALHQVGKLLAHFA